MTGRLCLIKSAFAKQVFFNKFLIRSEVNRLAIGNSVGLEVNGKPLRENTLEKRGNLCHPGAFQGPAGWFTGRKAARLTYCSAIADPVKLDRALVNQTRAETPLGSPGDFVVAGQNLVF